MWNRIKAVFSRDYDKRLQRALDELELLKSNPTAKKTMKSWVHRSEHDVLEVEASLLQYEYDRLKKELADLKLHYTRIRGKA